MPDYPLTLEDIVSWYRVKQLLLKDTSVSLNQIRKGSGGPKPGAAATFEGAGTFGEIDGWVSGEFDFHVLRAMDGKDVFWRHVDVSAVEELEMVYEDFVQSLLSLVGPD